ncbi:hypothetical protein ACO0LB_13675 [Undibacterium sp. SXout7W]|uniref:hypothetical protein n=1 Tax=Undibacterium sp. SXout7W TaxID=3413049 RepID=UPI003BF28FC4
MRDVLRGTFALFSIAQTCHVAGMTGLTDIADIADPGLTVDDALYCKHRRFTI